MGGRGSSSGMTGGSNSSNKKSYTTADKTVEVMPAKTIRTTDIENADYKSKQRELLNVTANGNGEITVSKARYRDTGEGSRKYPIYEYDVKGAYIYPGTDAHDYSDGRDATVVKGVNFENVKSVKGDTYNLRAYLKEKGFKWNGAKKAWEK